jgi:hypothetical protein
MSLVSGNHPGVINMRKEKELAVHMDVMLDNAQYDEIFYWVYPDSIGIGTGRGKLTGNEWRSRYDSVEVNEVILLNYLDWLLNDSSKIPADVKRSQVRDIKTILAISSVTGGKWYQRKYCSVFGRTWYTGLSMHTISKAMRANVLGHSWQYTSRSSEIAWKMSFAAGYNQEVKPERFQYTTHYMTDTEDFIEDCLINVFRKLAYTDHTGRLRYYSDEWSRGKIVDMLNAISFGGSVYGVLIPNLKDPDKPLTGSLGDIISDPVLRAAFLGHDLIRGFIGEHVELAEYILEKHRDVLSPVKCTKTVTGRRSKAKEIMYLHQHMETEIMNRVRELALVFGHPTLVSIHDTVIVRNRINVDDLYEVGMIIREEFGMPYWKLDGEKLSGYLGIRSSVISVMDRDEAEHKLIIQLQERVLSEGMNYRVTVADLTEESIMQTVSVIKESYQRSGLFTRTPIAY